MLKYIVMCAFMVGACASEVEESDVEVGQDSEAVINTATLKDIADHNHFWFHAVQAGTSIWYVVQTTTKLSTSQDFLMYATQGQDWVINYGHWTPISFSAFNTKQAALQDFANKLSKTLVRSEAKFPYSASNPQWRMSDNRIVTVQLEDDQQTQWSPGCGGYPYCSQQWPLCPNGSGWVCVGVQQQ